MLLVLGTVGAGGAWALLQAPPVGPRYADGALIQPEGIQGWIRVGSSLGLDYRPDGSGPARFHEVAMEPAAYRSVRRTGRFPEGTQLALTIYSADSGAPPARHGRYEGRLEALEMAVKDSKRYPGGWAYFGFGRGGPGSTARPFPPERCQQCHAAHGARDNVFTQFYPLLREGRR
jgi:hypothetical protein